MLLVWSKGRIVLGADPMEWRLDDYGYWIQYSAYGDRSSVFGWEIDHIWPVALNGGDNIENLRPLNWLSNVRR